MRACVSASRWVDVLGTELVSGSSSRPLLSGYYQVMATVLNLGEEGGLFEKSGQLNADLLAFQQV
jgi:hypothetical protein